MDNKLNEQWTQISDDYFFEDRATGKKYLWREGPMEQDKVKLTSKGVDRAIEYYIEKGRLVGINEVLDLLKLWSNQPLNNEDFLDGIDRLKEEANE